MFYARSAQPAKQVAEDGPIQLIPLMKNDDVQAAVDDASFVYEIDEATGHIASVLFDGEQWLSERPSIAEPTTYQLTTTDYVDARSEVVQSEIEALVEAIAETAPANSKLRQLQRNVLSARQAIGSNNCEQMAQVATILSATDDKPIFTIKQAKEMQSGESA